MLAIIQLISMNTMVAILHSSSSTSKSTFTMRCQGHESPVPHGKEFQFKFKYSYQHMHTIMDVCALLPFAKPFSNSQIQTSTHEWICDTHPLPLPAMIPKSNSYICMCTNMWKMCVLPLLANTIISYSQNYACTKILDTCPLLLLATHTLIKYWTCVPCRPRRRSPVSLSIHPHANTCPHAAPGEGRNWDLHIHIHTIAGTSCVARRCCRRYQRDGTHSCARKVQIHKNKASKKRCRATFRFLFRLAALDEV